MTLKHFANQFFYDIYVDLLIFVVLVIYSLWHYQTNWQCIVGLVLVVVSLVLWIVSRIQLGSAYSVEPQARQLVTHGIYSKIRNPMYVFSCLALLGVVLIWGKLDIFYVWIVIIVIQIIRAKKEQDILAKQFGVKYSDYAKHTWM